MVTDGQRKRLQAFEWGPAGYLAVGLAALDANRGGPAPDVAVVARAAGNSTMITVFDGETGSRISDNRSGDSAEPTVIGGASDRSGNDSDEMLIGLVRRSNGDLWVQERDAATGKRITSHQVG